LVRLRLIDIKNGKIDRDMKFNFGAGIVATSIYATSIVQITLITRPSYFRVAIMGWATTRTLQLNHAHFANQPAAAPAKMIKRNALR
jgi:hypothetical protein